MCSHVLSVIVVNAVSNENDCAENDTAVPEISAFCYKPMVPVIAKYGPIDSIFPEVFGIDTNSFE